MKPALAIKATCGSLPPEATVGTEPNLAATFDDLTHALMAIDMGRTVGSMTAELTCPATTAPELLQVDDAARWAVLFKALADPTRVRIVEYIASDDSAQVCACHLPDALGISQPTLSHHMRKLVDAGILHRVQRGRWADYSIDRNVLDRLRGWPANCRA